MLAAIFLHGYQIVVEWTLGGGRVPRSLAHLLRFRSVWDVVFKWILKINSNTHLSFFCVKIFKMCACPENDGDDGGDGGGNEARDPYSRAERLYQDIVKARTYNEFRAAIDDAAPVNYDSNPQLAAPSTLDRMVIVV